MFNLKVTGKTFHGEARVIASGDSGAVVQVNAEQLWTAKELRKGGCHARIRSETHGSRVAAVEA